ncbi:hypothetical protein Tco_1233914, partial [Tanacetum coccineum]
MLIKKKIHDSRIMKNTRFLITVNVLGSSGPLRFVVNIDDKVSEVINSSLKMYARGGRLPVLGSDYTKFLLYPSNSDSEAMTASEAVGSCGERTFLLCNKPLHPLMTEARLEMLNRHHRRQSQSR